MCVNRILLRIWIHKQPNKTRIKSVNYPVSNLHIIIYYLWLAIVKSTCKTKGKVAGCRLTSYVLPNTNNGKFSFVGTLVCINGMTPTG